MLGGGILNEIEKKINDEIEEYVYLWSEDDSVQLKIYLSDYPDDLDVEELFCHEIEPNEYLSEIIYKPNEDYLTIILDEHRLLEKYNHEKDEWNRDRNDEVISYYQSLL